MSTPQTTGEAVVSLGVPDPVGRKACDCLETLGGPQPTGRCGTCGTHSFAEFCICEKPDCDFERSDANPAGNTELIEANL